MTRAQLETLNNTLINGSDGTKITAAEHRQMNLALADYADEVAAAGGGSSIVGLADTSKTHSNTTDYPLYDAAKLNVYTVTEAGDYNTFAGTTGNTDLVITASDVEENTVSFYRQPNGVWSVVKDAKLAGPEGPEGPLPTQFVNSRNSALLSVWNGTQAQYDAIATKDPSTLYFVEA